MVLICISLMLSNVELLSSTCWRSVCLIRKKKNVQSERLPIFSIRLFLFCFFVIGSSEFFIYFNINPIMYMICKYFPPIGRLLFHFVYCSLYCVEAFFFLPYHVACGILIPGPGIQPRSPAVKAQSHTQWITREFLLFGLMQSHFTFYLCFQCLFFFLKHQDQC